MEMYGEMKGKRIQHLIPVSIYSHPKLLASMVVLSGTKDSRYDDSVIAYLNAEQDKTKIWVEIT